MLYFISVLSLALSLMSSLEAVLTRAEVFTLDYQGKKTTVIFLYDVHRIPEFAKREHEQTEELVKVIHDYVLKKEKQLCILAEQAPDLERELKEPITCFIKNLNEQVKSPYITAENIEQRAASCLIEDLAYSPDHAECTIVRSTATISYHAQRVSLQDVLDEFEIMDNYVKEAYTHASDRVPEIYAEKMALINEYSTLLKKFIEENNLPVDETFRYILDVIRENTEEQYRNCIHTGILELRELIDLIANKYFDLYILDRILSAPDGQTTVVLAGAGHCRYLLGEILGCLRAKGVFCCGLDENRRETIQPLTQQDLVQLFDHC